MRSLILGTAAFQQSYGISNGVEERSYSEIQELLKFSQAHGINSFDSAPTYAPAEELLGNYLDHSLEPKVSTKVDSKACNSVNEIIASVQMSIQKLRVEFLETLYIHDPASISNIQKIQIRDALIELKAMGLIENIGFSAYTMADVLQGIDAIPEINTIQVPENLADQRLFHSPELSCLKTEGISFVVRSVFLQGLLLMSPNKIPNNLFVFQSFLDQLISIAIEEECTVLELCLDYVSKIPWASHTLVGALNSRQIEEILHSRTVLPSDWQEKIKPIHSSLVDPRNWNQ